eukprot:TRINITY_DN93_c0_g1_i3.p1 TRINITY_DN93_c0_g1~~TRINITY_DN93_c0_g1_i3.p1  ORF type:complete len:498 (-),score=189.22 TRINITY_DN93_c0_g1_i3:258-1685(-)
MGYKWKIEVDTKDGAWDGSEIRFKKVDEKSTLNVKSSSVIMVKVEQPGWFWNATQEKQFPVELWEQQPPNEKYIGMGLLKREGFSNGYQVIVYLEVDNQIIATLQIIYSNSKDDKVIIEEQQKIGRSIQMTVTQQIPDSYSQQSAYPIPHKGTPPTTTSAVTTAKTPTTATTTTTTTTATATTTTTTTTTTTSTTSATTPKPSTTTPTTPTPTAAKPAAPTTTPTSQPAATPKAAATPKPSLLSKPPQELAGIIEFQEKEIERLEKIVQQQQQEIERLKVALNQRPSQPAPVVQPSSVKPQAAPQPSVYKPAPTPTPTPTPAPTPFKAPTTSATKPAPAPTPVTGSPLVNRNTSNSSLPASPGQTKTLTGPLGLLEWLKQRTQPYGEVQVRDFTTSWKDGLAYCALLHSFRPDLLNYQEVLKKTAAERLVTAFRVAEQLGIESWMDPQDMGFERLSMMTYLAEVYKRLGNSGNTN